MRAPRTTVRGSAPTPATTDQQARSAIAEARRTTTQEGTTMSIRNPRLLTALVACALVVGAVSITTAGSSRREAVRVVASRDTTVALRIPFPELHVEERGSSIRVWNEVDGPARSPFCDFEGTADPVTTIVDFDYTFSVVPKDDPIERTDWDRGGITLGGLEGRESVVGTHGCGQRIVRLAWGDDLVVRIEGPNPAELLHSSERDALLSIPGVIAPEVADAMLGALVHSLVEITPRGD